MALSMNMVTPTGFDSPNSYLRIEGLRQVDRSLTVVLNLRAYREGAKSPAFAESQFSFTYDLAGPNIIEQAYLALKAQPEYAAAVDV